MSLNNNGLKHINTDMLYSFKYRQLWKVKGYIYILIKMHVWSFLCQTIERLIFNIIILVLTGYLNSKAAKNMRHNYY